MPWINTDGCFGALKQVFSPRNPKTNCQRTDSQPQRQTPNIAATARKFQNPLMRPKAAWPEKVERPFAAKAAPASVRSSLSVSDEKDPGAKDSDEEIRGAKPVPSPWEQLSGSLHERLQKIQLFPIDIQDKKGRVSELNDHIFNFNSAGCAEEKLSALVELDKIVGKLGRIAPPRLQTSLSLLKTQMKIVAAESQNIQDAHKHQKLSDAYPVKNFKKDSQLDVADWVKPKPEYLPDREFDNSGDKYELRVVLQTQNDRTCFFSAHHLVDKHPGNTVFAQWNPTDGSFHVVHGPKDNDYHTMFADSITDFNDPVCNTGPSDEIDLPERSKITLIGHGNRELKTLLGHQEAKTVGESFLKLAKTHFNDGFPEKISLAVCHAASNPIGGSAAKLTRTIADPHSNYARHDAEIDRLRLTAFEQALYIDMDGRKYADVTLEQTNTPITMNRKSRPPEIDDWKYEYSFNREDNELNVDTKD